MGTFPGAAKGTSYRLEATWSSLAQGTGCQPQLDPLVPPQPPACSGWSQLLPALSCPRGLSDRRVPATHRALSVAECGGGRGTQCTTVPSSTQEEEDLALAQALSASEAEYQQSQRQVSEAGRRLCALVGWILAWPCHRRGASLGSVSSGPTFLTRRAAQPGAVTVSLKNTQRWGLEHRGRSLTPLALCASSHCRHTVRSHRTAACRRQGVPEDMGSRL